MLLVIASRKTNKWHAYDLSDENYLGIKEYQVIILLQIQNKHTQVNCKYAVLHISLMGVRSIRVCDFLVLTRSLFAYLSVSAWSMRRVAWVFFSCHVSHLREMSPMFRNTREINT